MYVGGFKQVLYKEYICWIQVKIHISDQTSLRICNSVGMTYTSIQKNTKNVAAAPRIGLVILLPSAHQTMLLERTFMLVPCMNRGLDIERRIFFRNEPQGCDVSKAGPVRRWI